MLSVEAGTCLHQGRIFSCNHVSSGRGESINSTIKEKGQKKKELRKFNLYQLFQHILTLFDRGEARALDEICDLIRSNGKWSKYVDTIWQNQYKLCSDLPFVEKSDQTVGCDWTAKSSNLKVCHEIKIEDLELGGIPSCNCRHFLSTRIPCTGICAVFSRLTTLLFRIENLHHRWRLNHHPLHSRALQKLNLVCEQTNTVRTIGISHQVESRMAMQSEIDLTAYQSIVFPNARDLRYTKLNNLFKTVEPLVMNNENFYKLLTLNLTKFKNSVESGAPCNFLITAGEPDGIAPQNSHSSDNAALSISANEPIKRGRSVREDLNR